MWRISRFITRTYFRFLSPMRKLEHSWQGPSNTARFHKKYGKGRQCMITDCHCKAKLKEQDDKSTSDS